MEDNISSLLNEWGFAKYTEAFLENEIDIEALELLDDLQINILIPIIGPQAKFKKKLCDWKTTRQPALCNDNKNEEQDIDILENIVSLCEKSLPASPLSSASGSSHLSDGFIIESSERSLIKLLEKTQDGNLLLSQRSQLLGDNLRKILTKEITKEIVNKNPKAPVTADIYLHWLDEIKKVFPAEDCDLYYTAPDTTGRPHGRIYDAVGNLKTKYRKNRVYQARPRRCLQFAESRQKTPHRSLILKNDLHDIEESDQEKELNTEETNDCLEWLKSSVDDYTLCAEKWRITRKLRQQRVLSEKELQTYLLDFPCLKRSWGLKLLLQDFDKWYPENELIFQNKFPLLMIKLKSVFEKNSVKNSFVTKLKALAKDADPQASTLATLMLIPYILGPIHVKRKKISASEVRESFILHIEEEKQFNEARTKRQEKYKDLGITIQPYIVVAGSLEQITRSYVVLNDIVYEVACISEAVDACFKIIWALYLEYPRECLHVWQFLQRAIYIIPHKAIDKRERVMTSVLALLSDCGISTK